MKLKYVFEKGAYTGDPEKAFLETKAFASDTAAIKHAKAIGADYVWCDPKDSNPYGVWKKPKNEKKWEDLSQAERVDKYFKDCEKAMGPKVTKVVNNAVKDVVQRKVNSMKNVYVVYTVQISGSLAPTGKYEARGSSIIPSAVFETKEEADFRCEQDERTGLNSFYGVVPLLSFSKNFMRAERTSWKKRKAK